MDGKFLKYSYLGKCVPYLVSDVKVVGNKPIT